MCPISSAITSQLCCLFLCVEIQGSGFAAGPLSPPSCVTFLVVQCSASDFSHTRQGCVETVLILESLPEPEAFLVPLFIHLCPEPCLEERLVESVEVTSSIWRDLGEAGEAEWHAVVKSCHSNKNPEAGLKGRNVGRWRSDRLFMIMPNK